MLSRTFLVLLSLACAPTILRAQGGFEYEVYSTEIEAPRATTLELHTNFVQSGRREIDEEQFATHHALRSSFEIARGLLPWLEGSVYFVGAAYQGRSAAYVGNRLRLTAVAPAKWNLPFDLGLSNEVGYARPGYSEYRWAYELSPIIGKSFGSLSIVLNPALEKGLSASGEVEGEEEYEFEFEPRAKIGYSFGDEAALALEYYGSVGSLTEFAPAHEQHHQLFATAETEVAHRWEFGAGIGRGLTRDTDRLVLMTKIEYHFGGEHEKD